MVGVQNERRVSQSRVIRAVSELASSSCPGIGRLTLARSLLLDIVSSVQLAVVASWARLRVGKTWLTGSVSGGGCIGHYVAIAIGRTSIPTASTGDIPIGKSVGVRVAKKCTFVELLSCSHIDRVLPGLFGQFLGTNHWKGGSKWNVEHTIAVCGSGSGCGSRDHTRSDGADEARLTRARISRGTSSPLLVRAIGRNTGIVFHRCSLPVTS